MDDGQASSLAPWIRILPSEEMLKEYHVAYVTWRIHIAVAENC
jgi:hypothetical protein